jgi:hypothetical protein
MDKTAELILNINEKISMRNDLLNHVISYNKRDEDLTADECNRISYFRTKILINLNKDKYIIGM